MFFPAAHVEPDTQILLQLIQNNPLGILITGISSTTQSTLQCTHVPFVLDPPTEGDLENPYGRLRAHIAKQNPQVKSMVEAMPNARQESAQLLDEVLVLFNGAHNHYITPKYYTETKPASGKVVPTWNYSAAQVYGRLTLHYDSTTAATRTFLDKQTRDLSANSETGIMGYDGVSKPGPWKVSDAPERYIELLQKNIVGLEIQITRIEGKFKMSQEMRAGDRAGVIKGLAALGTDASLNLSALVDERSRLAEQKKVTVKSTA